MNRRIFWVVYILTLAPFVTPCAFAQWPGVWYDGHRTRHAPGHGALTGDANGIPGVSFADHVWNTSVRGAALIDLDTDGRPELLVAAHGRVHAYDVSTGTLNWASGAIGANFIFGVGQLIEGGSAELVVGADTAGARLWVLDSSTGSLLSTQRHATRNASVDRWRIVMVNVDEDEALELVWRPVTTARGTMYIADYDTETGAFITRDAPYEGDPTSHQIMAADVDGDGHAEILVNQIGDLRVWHPDIDRYDVFPDIRPGHAHTEKYLFRLPPNDGWRQVVTSSVYKIGLGVVDPGPEGGRIWGCWLGSGSRQRPRLESATQRTPPMDINGDGEPDLVIAFKGGGIDLDPAYGPCPAADLLQVEADWTTHLFDLRTGRLLAQQGGLEPIEVLDLLPGGGAEILGTEGRRDVLYTFSEDGMRAQGEIPGDVIRVISCQRDPRAVVTKARAVIHRTADGVGQILVRVNGTYQFYDPNSEALVPPPANLADCGPPTDVYLDDDQAATVAFRSGTTICVYDVGGATVSRIDDLPGEAAELLMAEDLDGDNRSELMAFNQVYDIDPGSADPVSLRYATGGRLRFVAHGATPAGPLPMVISISDAQVTAHGPDGHPIWVYDLADDRARHRISHVEAAPFLANDGDDFAIVLDDRVDPNGRDILIATYADGELRVSESIPVARGGGLVFTADTYQSLFMLPAELGQPDQWGVADGQIDLLFRGARDVSFLDADSGDPLANPAGLDLARTPVRIYSTADVDRDGIDELIALPGDFSRASGPAALFELGPSGLGEAYEAGEPMVPLWTTLIPAPMTSHFAYAVFSNADGRYRIAYVNAVGGLFVLDAQTGALLNGYPIYLREGESGADTPEDGVTIESLIAFDVDGDDEPELLAGSRDGWLYAIDGETQNGPHIIWTLYLGVPVSQVIPAYLEGADAIAELAVVTRDGRVLGLGAAAANLHIVEQMPADFVGPELSLSGTATGANQVEVLLNGVVMGRVAVDANQWSLPAFELPDGCAEVRAVGFSGEDETARDARRYCTDWDQDGLANWLDCLAMDGHRNPRMRPDRAESCDAVDNDCDGAVDEELAPPPAENAVGICAGSVQVCAGADGWQAPDLGGLDGYQADESVCDGQDNDCDGTIDENTASAVITCGIGACETNGREECIDGEVVETCTPDVPAEDELCNGIDDDCDGTLDEQIPSRPLTCGVGLCRAPGSLVCQAGEMVEDCTPFEPAVELCDGLDNDCDDLADEGLVSAPISCGLGECRTPGRLRCVNGRQVEECTPGIASPEVCNGLDDDCNGGVDDGLEIEVVRCGVGACEVRGQRRCMGGEFVVLCEPFEPGEETCNGRDDDCDGRTDEALIGQQVRCGIGACSAEGRQVCAEGQWADDCSPNSPLDEECDGLDNDCDAVIDEEIAPVPTTCGLGTCAAEGVATCIEGVMLNACAAGPPSDEVCDGIDNDCDGVIDDQIVAVPTRCGIGACAADGEQGCFDGEVSDTCQPLSPGVEVCDGIDNDCDGDTDEDASGEVTECGIGGCASIGTLVCVDGELVNTCRPRRAEAEVCDALDNDCNGEIDDGLDPQDSTCGVGACTAMGTWTCTDGMPMDTCTPGEPSEDICDALDNDCDGEVDEDDACASTADAAQLPTDIDAALAGDGGPPPSQQTDVGTPGAQDAAAHGGGMLTAPDDNGCSCDVDGGPAGPYPWMFLLLTAYWKRRRHR